MTTDEIRELTKQGKIYRFYKSPEWLALRGIIMAECHGECQWCRERGIISKAETVHHVQWVKTHPELAMSRTYRDEYGEIKQNLIPLCHDCHDRAHKRMRYAERKIPPPEEQLNEERW